MTILFILYFIIAICFVAFGIHQGNNNKIAWGMLVFAIMAIFSPIVAWYCLI